MKLLKSLGADPQKDTPVLYILHVPYPTSTSLSSAGPTSGSTHSPELIVALQHTVGGASTDLKPAAVSRFLTRVLDAHGGKLTAARLERERVEVRSH